MLSCEGIGKNIVGAPAKLVLKFLRYGVPLIMGSDCHSMESRRPNVKEAAEIIERKLGREMLFRISDIEHRIFDQTDWNGVIE